MLDQGTQLESLKKKVMETVHVMEKTSISPYHTKIGTDQKYILSSLRVVPVNGTRSVVVNVVGLIWCLKHDFYRHIFFRSQRNFSGV